MTQRSTKGLTYPLDPKRRRAAPLPVEPIPPVPVAPVAPRDEPDGPRLYDIRDVAARLRCSTSAVYKHVYAGRLACVYLGTDRRFTPEGVAAFIAALPTGKAVNTPD